MTNQQIFTSADTTGLNIMAAFRAVKEAQLGSGLFEKAESRANWFASKIENWFESGKALFIEFDESWNNGTGYFNELAEIGFHKQGGLKIGQLVFTFDPETNRRIVVIVGRYGNVVLFDRYSNGHDAAIAGNNESIYRWFVPTGYYSSDDLFAAFPHPELSGKHDRFLGGVMEEFESLRSGILYRDKAK